MPFFEFAIPRAGLTTPVFGSSPFDDQMAGTLKAWPGGALSTEGDELLVFARRIADSRAGSPAEENAPKR